MQDAERAHPHHRASGGEIKAAAVVFAGDTTIKDFASYVIFVFLTPLTTGLFNSYSNYF